MTKKRLINTILFLVCFILISPYAVSVEVVEVESQAIKKDNTQPSSTNQKNFNPKPASASLYNLGLRSYDQGDIQSAITYFKRAIDLDSQFVDAYYNLGAIYKLQKKYLEAIVAFEKAAQINPNDYEVIFELASCYFEEQDYAKAKKYFAVVPTNFPKYSEARKKLELINQSVALEDKAGYENQEAVSHGEFQAQLLANKLGTIESKSIVEDTKPVNSGTEVVKSLQKTTQEQFEGNYRIVTRNLKGPTGIVKDSRNNIYVANFAKDSIEKISTDGTKEIFIEKLGIDGPIGLAIDENDNLFVANYKNGSIVQITPNKEVSYLVQKLEKPYYLFYDSSTKKLFATVQGNNALVEIDTGNILKQPITSR